MELSVDARKGGDHFDCNHRDGDGDGDDHNSRVAERGLELVAGIFIPLKVFVQAQEGLLELSAGLPHAHDADVERGENLGATLHGAGQIAALFERGEKGCEGHTQCRCTGGIHETFEPTVNRHSGTRQGVHLAAEQKEIIRPDPTAGPQAFQGGEPVRFGRSRPNLNGGDADREQLVGDRLGAFCLPESGDEGTAPVAAAESVLNHSGRASLERVDLAKKAQDLAQAGQAVFCVTQGAADEAHITRLASGRLGNARGCLASQGIGQRDIDLQQFEHANPTPKTTVIAERATPPPSPLVWGVGEPLCVEPGYFLWRGNMNLGAIRTETADQALGNHGIQGGRNKVAPGTHVEQSIQSRWCVVGMQCGQDKMSHESGPKCHLHGFLVADLAHHDDVGILPERGSQDPGKVEPDPWVDLDLADAGQPVFDGILDRDDFDGWVIDRVQDRIQGRRLTATRRSRDEQHAGRPCDERLETGEEVGGKPQLIKTDEVVSWIQQPHDDTLAVGRGEGGKSDIESPLFDPETEASVLWQSTLRDVEPRHEFETGDDGLAHPTALDQLFMEDAVNPLTHPELVFLRFEMNIGGARLDGILEQRFQQADDRLFSQHFALPELFDVEIAAFPEFGTDFLRKERNLFCATVDDIDGPDKVPLGDQAQLQRFFEDPRELVIGEDVGRVDHADKQIVRAILKHDRPVAPGIAFREQADGFRLEPVPLEIDERDPELSGKEVEQGLLVDEAEFDQDPTELVSRLSLFDECRFERIFRNDLLAHQEIADADPFRWFSERAVHAWGRPFRET